MPIQVATTTLAEIAPELKRECHKQKQLLLVAAAAVSVSLPYQSSNSRDNLHSRRLGF